MQVYICGFGRKGVSVHSPHCCFHYCILGALLRLQASLEPAQHSSPQKREKITVTKKLFALVPQLQGDSGEVSLLANAEFWAPSPALLLGNEALWLSAVASAVPG